MEDAARTVYLLGETPSNAQSDRLGVYDRLDGELVNGRWAYVKRDDSAVMMWYDNTEPVAWLVGDTENLGGTSGGCRCRDAAASPDRAGSKWEVGFKGKPIPAPSLRCLSGPEGEDALAAHEEQIAQRKAAAIEAIRSQLDAAAYTVYLVGETPSNAQSNKIGAYDRLDDGLVNGRWAYVKRDDDDIVMWYDDSEPTAWLVGTAANLGSTSGGCRCRDSAIAPDQVGTGWVVGIKGKPIPAPSLRCLSGAEGEAAMAAHEAQVALKKGAIGQDVLDAAAQTIYLVGETPSNAQRGIIGAYDRREAGLVNGRWAYVKRDDSDVMLWYDDTEPVAWLVGDADDLGSTECRCRCGDSAVAPDRVAAKWEVGVKGRAIPAPSLRCLSGAEGEDALAAHEAQVAQRKAEAIEAIRGQLEGAARTVYLFGETPSDAQSDKVGVYDRRDGELVNGRWAYVKRDDSDVMMWYDDTEPVAWLIGNDLGSTSGGCRCRDSAIAPDQVDTGWEVGYKGKPIPAPSLRCLSGVEGEAAMAAHEAQVALKRARAAEDRRRQLETSARSVYLVGDTPGNAQRSAIGAYDRRDGELVNGRWAYVKRDDSDVMLWYDDTEPVAWLVGDADDLGSTECRCRCGDSAVAPDRVAAKWEVGVKGRAIPAPSLRCLSGAEGEDALAAHEAQVAQRKAEAIEAIRGQLEGAARTVYLFGETPSDAQSDKVGVYDRRDGELVNGRWAYVKRDDSDVMMWYDDTEPVAWMVGDAEKLGGTSAGCRCPDSAIAPDQVCKGWDVGVRGKPIPAPLLRCQSGVDGEVAMAKFTGDSPLILSCMANDLAGVARILADGASVGEINKKGDTPLIVTCARGHDEVAALLIKHGASVHDANRSGLSPLAASCRSGHRALAAMLLSKGAAVNAVTEELDSPLTLCCKAGHTAIAQLLFDHDADVNHANASEQTALTLASANGRTSCKEFIDRVAPCTQFAWRLSTVPRTAWAAWYCNVVEATLRLSPLAVDFEAANALLDVASSHDAALADVADVRGGLATAQSVQLDAEEGSSCMFHFVKTAELLADGDLVRLPSLNELRLTRPHWLETRLINFADACLGAYTHSIVAVSHRWDSVSEPDPTGEQLRAVRAYLVSNPRIELLFYDFSSMPQRERLPHEHLEFSRMLPNINLLYLGCSVLILMDRTYLGCALRATKTPHPPAPLLHTSYNGCMHACVREHVCMRACVRVCVCGGPRSSPPAHPVRPAYLGASGHSSKGGLACS